MTREFFAEIDGFRRRGDYDVAYFQAVSALDDAPGPDIAAVATATIGRIEFEYERYARAAEWLQWAVSLLSAGTVSPSLIDGGWLEALAALALAKVPGPVSSPAGVPAPSGSSDRQQIWVQRRVGRGPTPVYDADESWELLLAGCRVHHAACQSASIDEMEKVYEAARVYTRAVEARLEATPDASAIVDRTLASAPITTDFCYHQAALAFATGCLEEADDHLARLAGLVGGDRHVTGLLASVQVARDRGLPLSERRARIDRAVAHLGPTFEAVTSNRSDPSGRASRHEIGFEAKRQRLERHRALTYSISKPHCAYAYLLEADSARSGEHSTSHARLRFLTKSNASLTLIAKEIDLLLAARGLELASSFIPNVTAGGGGRPAAVASRAELGALAGVLARYVREADPGQDLERALLAVADTLRSLDHDAAALEWYGAMHTVLPRSGAVAGRYVSTLTTLGHLDQARGVADRHEDERGNRRELVHQEMGRLELAAGDPAAAERHLEPLASNPWARVAIDARCGLIDAARRRRDLPEVRRRSTDARAAMAGLDPALPAEADIAQGWAEVQLGVPRAGLHLLVRALSQLPYSVGGWIGVIRALRMLGCHDQAFEVVNRLSGEPSQQPLPWWDDNDLMVGPDGQHTDVPDISLRHQPRLDNERGWASLDLDRCAEARNWFVRSLGRTPDLAQPYRGLVAACRNRDEVTVAVGLADQRLAEAVRNTAEIRRDLHLEAARTLVHIGEPASAARHVEQMWEHHAASGAGVGVKRRLLYTLAGAHLDAKDLPAASEILRRAVQLDAAGGADERPASRSRRSLDERPVIFEARRLLVAGRSDDAAELLDRTVLERDGAVSEPLRIARVVAAFERRDFASAEELVTGIGGPPEVAGEGSPPPWSIMLPDSEIQPLLKAWIFLACSELPANDRQAKQALVVRAERELARSDESSVEELHLRAILEARRAALGLGGSRAAAEQYLTLAIERRPGDGGLRRDLGAVRFSFGRLGQAAVDLEEAHRLQPHDARIALLRGAVSHAGTDSRAALEYFRTAVALDPTDYVHHRALVVALLEFGRTDDALRAVRAGLEAVRTQRRFRLELLQARVHAERAAELDHDGRATELRRAEQVLRSGTEASSAVERAELAARQAYLAARRGHQRRARRLLRQARRSDDSSADVKHLEVQLKGENGRQADRFTRWVIYLLAVLGAVFSLVLYVVMIRQLLVGEEPVSVNDLVVMIGLAAGLPLLALATPRIRSLKLFQVAVELDEATPVQEAVHIDLDLSASDLLRVSGFSNHRPNVPFDDVEARELEY